MTEVLVLLRPSPALTARELARREPIVRDAPQVFGDCVVIATLPAAACAEISSMADVRGVFAGAIPPEVDLPADPVGRIAVDAWNVRRAADAEGGKRRIGEGAAWDDPRFEREGTPGSDAD